MYKSLNFIVCHEIQTKFEAKLKWNKKNFNKIKFWSIGDMYSIPTKFLDREDYLKTTLLGDWQPLPSSSYNEIEREFTESPKKD